MMREIQRRRDVSISLGQHLRQVRCYSRDTQGQRTDACYTLVCDRHAEFIQCNKQLRSLIRRVNVVNARASAFAVIKTAMMKLHVNKGEQSYTELERIVRMQI